jgi:hypothetical protein
VVTQVIIGFRYLISGIIIVSYYAKKRIKPLFSDIGCRKDLYIKIIIIFTTNYRSLYGAAMFGIGSLIAINC